VRVGVSGRVVAIEASPVTYELLIKNIGLNPELQNIRAVNCAASDVTGRARIYRGPDESTGLTSVLPRKGNVFEAEVGTKPLIEILTPAEIQRLRMVKIDVEGAEFQVVEGLFQSGLRGMRNDLEIVIETSKDWIYRGQRGSVDKMIYLFRQWGFNAYGMKKQVFVNPTTMLRPVRIGEDPSWGYFDLIFSRRDREQL
jgi:FkbM family methyltransferase